MSYKKIIFIKTCKKIIKWDILLTSKILKVSDRYGNFKDNSYKYISNLSKVKYQFYDKMKILIKNIWNNLI